MLQRFSGGSPSVRNKLNAIVDEVNPITTIRGDEQFVAVKRSPGGCLVSLNIAAVLARVPRTQRGSDAGCIVSITGTTLNGLSCGKGKYKGAYYDLELSAPFSITTDASNSEITDTAADCLVINMAEVNGTAHYLTDIVSDQVFFIGRIIGTTASGSGTDPTLTYPVIVIDGKQWKAC